MGLPEDVHHHGLVLRTRNRKPPTSRSRQAGYVAAIVVNGLIAYAANNLLDWDIVPFLTTDFERVLPAINLSLGITIAVNFLRLAYDAPWFTRITEVISLTFSLAASLRVFRVFPFDFDGRPAVFEPLFRLMLIVAIVGSAIAIIAQLAKLVIAKPEDSEL